MPLEHSMIVDSGVIEMLYKPELKGSGAPRAFPLNLSSPHKQYLLVLKGLGNIPTALF